MQVLKVFRVFRGQSDLKVQLVLELKVQQVLKVHKVLLVHRVHKELKVISV